MGPGQIPELLRRRRRRRRRIFPQKFKMEIDDESYLENILGINLGAVLHGCLRRASFKRNKTQSCVLQNVILSQTSLPILGRTKTTLGQQYKKIKHMSNTNIVFQRS